MRQAGTERRFLPPQRSAAATRGSVSAVAGRDRLSSCAPCSVQYTTTRACRFAGVSRGLSSLLCFPCSFKGLLELGSHLFKRVLEPFSPCTAYSSIQRHAYFDSEHFSSVDKIPDFRRLLSWRKKQNQFAIGQPLKCFVYLHCRRVANVDVFM